MNDPGREPKDESGGVGKQDKLNSAWVGVTSRSGSMPSSELEGVERGAEVGLVVRGGSSWQSGDGMSTSSVVSRIWATVLAEWILE